MDSQRTFTRAYLRRVFARFFAMAIYVLLVVALFAAAWTLGIVDPSTDYDFFLRLFVIAFIVGLLGPKMRSALHTRFSRPS